MQGYLQRGMRLALLLLFLVLSMNVQGLAESKLNNYVISNIGRADLLSLYESKINVVVVGYDAAVTDYLAGAQLAVWLTAHNGKTSQVRLQCGLNDEIITLFEPATRQVPLVNDRYPSSGNRLLIGGAASNEAVKSHPEVAELLKKPGDMVVKRYGSDLIIAGFTGFDTERAVEYALDLLRQA